MSLMKTKRGSLINDYKLGIFGEFLVNASMQSHSYSHVKIVDCNATLLQVAPPSSKSDRRRL